MKARAIAFYLPQFHPIPENDAWWGKGFTEWTNVVRARPLFPGHYQPHLPADLGFYDLRLAESREAQANLAREYGIYGFCYYHYWFNGKRLLHRPFNDVLESGKPDFPFCLCWANENWTRTWDGLEREILIEQKYSHEDDERHINWLVKAFADRRYIRVEGKPLFLVYRASKLLSPIKTTSIWRKRARELGIGELFLCRVESFADERVDPSTLGFDAAVEFQPDWMNNPSPLKTSRVWSAAWRASAKLGLSNVLLPYVSLGARAHHNRIYDYSRTVERMLMKPVPWYRRFPCVTPSWDNSPRRKTGAVIYLGSSPTLYRAWLERTIERDKSKEKIVFVNAWNEWGEGNHLEPCQRWGRAYLEATLKALSV